MDLYCERCGPEFWAEPINAVSNISFLLAALLAWYRAKLQQVKSRELSILIGLAALVGVGSFLFHTFATVLTMYLDIIPILIFQLFFIWVYARQQMRWNVASSACLLVGLLGTSLAGLPMRDVLNGSLMYVPAWLLLVAFGAFHIRQEKKQPWTMLSAGVVLFFALVFRTIDLAVCETIPCGTHFLWHLLNGVVFFLILESLIQNPPDVATQ